MGEAPKLKLMYFDIKGKGEPIRLALRYLGLPFEDYRFKDRSDFMEMKTSGKLMFGQVPALFVDGKVLNQTPSILRYVAKLGSKLGKKELYPKDEFEAARVDAIMDQEADAFMGLRVSKYKQRFGFDPEIFTDEVAQRIAKAQNELVIPYHMERLEAIMKGSDSQWLAGTKEPSIADFLWVPVLESIMDGWSGDKTVLDKFPTLTQLVQAFKALPELQ